jgi:hypothetical protein
MSTPAFPLAPAPAPSRPVSWWARHGRALGVLGLIVAVTLCLGGGTGAFFLLNATEDRGESEPTGAITGFLNAVLHDHDADGATRYVCVAARQSNDVQQLVEAVEDLQDKYPRGIASWAVPDVAVNRHHAAANVNVTFDRDGEQVGAEKLRLSLVDQQGWWVCDVNPPQ